MKKLQTGRSMIEMLGVLAIIGVLSIGGLVGYTYAMNKYRANEAVQAASMGISEVLMASYSGTQKSLNIDEIIENIDGIADMTLENSGSRENAYIKLDFKSKEVCRQFKDTFTSTSDYMVVGKCEDEE